MTAERPAGLRYVKSDEPGYTRRPWGRGFTYRDPDGHTVPRGPERRRLERLVIPPAWTDVWICADEDGHLQATGRDDAGRKQYIYHPRWVEARARAKFERLTDFAHALPEIRAAVDEELGRKGLVRERVLAAIVRLLETSLIRVGNDDYAERNGSYGLTTLRKHHVESDADHVVLEFRGKSGRSWEVEVSDSPVMAVIRECMELPGARLFKYRDDDAEIHEVTSAEVNDYLHHIGPSTISAKTFRTWAGTVLTARMLWGTSQEESASMPPQRVVTTAVRRAAKRLGNTPAVCRSAYVHPAVIEGFVAGELRPPEPEEAPSGALEGLQLAERTVLRFLEDPPESAT